MLYQTPSNRQNSFASLKVNAFLHYLQRDAFASRFPSASDVQDGVETNKPRKVRLIRFQSTNVGRQAAPNLSMYAVREAIGRCRRKRVAGLAR